MTVNFLIFIISSSCFRRRSLDFQAQFTVFFFIIWHQTSVNNNYDILSWCFSFITLHLIFHRASRVSRRRSPNHTYCNLNGLPDPNRPKLRTTSTCWCRPEPYGWWRIGLYHIYWTRSKTRSWAGWLCKRDGWTGAQRRQVRILLSPYHSLLLNMSFCPFLWRRTPNCPSSLRRV